MFTTAIVGHPEDYETLLGNQTHEYIDLSTSLRETISIMELLHKIQDQGFDIKLSKPTVHCKVFKDNSSMLEIATGHTSM